MSSRPENVTRFLILMELFSPAVQSGFGSAITRSVGSPTGRPLAVRYSAPSGAPAQPASMSVGTPLMTIVSPRPQRAKSEPRMTPTGSPTDDDPIDPVKPSLLYGTNSAPRSDSTLLRLRPNTPPISNA